MSSVRIHNTRSVARRMLTCFCGCTNLSPEDVKRLYRFSAIESLQDNEALKLFRSFLSTQQCDDDAPAKQFLKLYELCSNYLSENTNISNDEIDELSESGLRYIMEKQLRNDVKSGRLQNIQRTLHKIQQDCGNELELTQEFKNYKAALLKKLSYERN